MGERPLNMHVESRRHACFLLTMFCTLIIRLLQICIRLTEKELVLKDSVSLLTYDYM